jgi:hypothetical protein
VAFLPTILVLDMPQTLLKSEKVFHLAQHVTFAESREKFLFFVKFALIGTSTTPFHHKTTPPISCMIHRMVCSQFRSLLFPHWLLLVTEVIIVSLPKHGQMQTHLFTFGPLGYNRP